jgi:hypothetical protein
MGGDVIQELRRLHNEELYCMYSSPNIIGEIKPRRIRWAGHVARLDDRRSSHRVLLERPGGKRSVERPRSR